jgi:hypothetical protein
MDYGSNGAGKGDSYRPVNYAEYCKNWDKIFAKKKPSKKKLDKPKKKRIM